MARAARRARVGERGGVYVVVMGAAALVTAAGLAAITAARMEAREVESAADVAQARMNAESAIMLGRLAIRADEEWRESMPDGAWFTGRTLGRGTATLMVTDPVDGVIGVGENDPVVLTGIGRAGGARQMIRVRLASERKAVNSLGSLVHAGGSISFATTTMNVTGLVSSNGSVTATSSNIGPAVQAVGTVTGTNYSGGTRGGSAAKQMPGVNAAGWYTLNGTPIGMDLLEKESEGRVMQNVVLSPSENPIGGKTDAAGVYVIDCEGQNVLVTNCRIVGTLVLLNTGPGSMIHGSVVFEPGAAGLPALVVIGPMMLALSSAALSEPALSVNFNPPGTPFNGVEDSDKVDTYPTGLTGLVYISGDAVVEGPLRMTGALLVGGTLTCRRNNAANLASRLDIAYDTAVYTSPAPGFEGPPEMVLVRGTYERVVD